jgi:flagellar M-ring protein FliF
MNQLRQQLSKFWGSQSKTQKLVLIVLVGTGVVLIPLFLVWASAPTYAVAFSGLSEADAGQIVEKLNEDGIDYQLKSSGTILVQSNQVYDVRLKMARQGLPEGGTVGFELFNGNTLGMTEFTQRVNYQQALEGELERTIGSLEVVEAVRVHIVTPEKSLLSSDQAPTTASITIKEKAGGGLDMAQVSSITHLVASSVEGLDPENVVVVDVNGNMLASGGSDQEGAALAQTDSRRNAEIVAADELKGRVQELLDQALGPNKSVVQASISMDWTERETTTQKFEPNPESIRSSTEVTETYTTTNGTIAGIPGATTNLPPAGSGVTGDSGTSFYNRAEKTTNYEITQVESREVLAPGEVKRISLSVLVDGVTDPAKLASLKTVISAAAGIDEARGDSLAVETLAFDRSYYEAEATGLEEEGQQDLYFRIGEAVAAGLLLLLLLWYVQRLLKNLRLASAREWAPVLQTVPDLALAGGQPAGGSPGLPSAAPEGLSIPQLEQSLAKAFANHQPPQALSEPVKPAVTYQLPKVEQTAFSEEYRQLQDYIDDLADQDASTLAEIIQIWLNEDERRNG